MYGTDEEPDPRFSLAPERTLLSWRRTCLAVGVLCGAFLLLHPTG